MASNKGGPPIQLVETGGVPITNLYGATNAAGEQISAPIFTPTEGKGGMVATLVEAGGWPVILVNDGGSEWEPESEEEEE